MNNRTLIRTLIVAVPLAVVGLAAAYFYGDLGRSAFQEAVELAPGSDGSTESSGKTDANVAARPPAGGSEKSSAQPETVVAQPGPDAERPAAPVEGPSFDVVGVEPTGETVVAGRSDAGAIVALTANGDVVGKSIANEAGEWTIILEEPLKPGDYDVGLEVHDEKGDAIEESTQRLAVSVPESGKEQPLVVLNAPNAPSDILQKPATEQLTAGASAPTTAATDQAAAPSTQEVAGSAKTPAGQAEGQGEETVVAALPKPASDGETGAAAQSAAQQSSQPDTASDTSSAAAQSDASEPRPQPAQQASENQPETPAQSDQTQTAGVSNEENVQVTAATENQAAPESSGTSEGLAQTPGAADQAPATATAQSGAPTTETAAGEVSGNGVQQQTASVEQAGSANGAQQSEGTATRSLATASQDQPAPQVTVEAVESEPDKVYVAGTGKPGSSVRVYVGEDYQGEAKVNSSGKWLVEGTKNVAEGDIEVRADLIGGDGNTVDARAAVTFEKEQEKQIVLTKVVATGSGGGQDSQGADVQKSLPVVIIRKGDNLWRISRRLYGDGVRYTTIYQANQDQIRDPDLIYPGQVFLTPEGDLNWPDPNPGSANRG
ncbi:LysM peptidoglycan-binding domain-containing protein [uncultured Roseibium sp.]|uniref:LysM peptidoglycan-binding domain-containing protein n=1 Tax=uncultured Roseibium sp. TaxID=1936171 RepID=UPI0026149EC2|nr:LysM peptidoglycan-binding domain-containing protein [uncultured Roseibium sp.]